jgi:hypothetical protein
MPRLISAPGGLGLDAPDPEFDSIGVYVRLG